MPIYEYQCTGCQHQFDVLQKLNDAPVTLCPSCNKEMAIRLVSAAGFQLKGSGWYETDFKHKGRSEKSTSTSGSSETKSVDIKSKETSTTTSTSSTGGND